MFKKIFNLFGYVKKSNTNLTDEGRDKSIEMRALRSELRQAQNMLQMRQQIQMLQQGIAESTGKESSFEDELLQGLLQGLVAGKQQPTVNVQQIEFTDEEIMQMLGTIPKQYLKMGKSMPDETIAKFVLSKFPALSEDTLQRVIFLYRQQYK